MEGILLERGVIIPGQKFEYKEVHHEIKKLFGGTKIKTAKQTYHELILDLFLTLL